MEVKLSSNLGNHDRQTWQPYIDNKQNINLRFYFETSEFKGFRICMSLFSSVNIFLLLRNCLFIGFNFTRVYHLLFWDRRLGISFTVNKVKKKKIGHGPSLSTPLTTRARLFNIPLKLVLFWKIVFAVPLRRCGAFHLQLGPNSFIVLI